MSGLQVLLLTQKFATQQILISISVAMLEFRQELFPFCMHEVYSHGIMIVTFLGLNDHLLL